jgi:hypothetical protein
MVTLPVSFGTDFLANVGDQISDPGLLAVILIAVGIPFAFWFIKRVAGVIPKGK